MKIKMLRQCIMPFGIFSKDMEYDTTNQNDELSMGQAKTFVLCGAAIDITPSINEVVSNDSVKKSRRVHSKN